LVTSCVVTAFKNAVLKERFRNDRSDGKTRKRTSSCWMTLRKETILQVDSGNAREPPVETLL
jgi:hypothetical protein